MDMMTAQACTARRDKGRAGYHSGLAAEEIVARHCAALGLLPCARRWRGQGGEIDLIFRDGAEIVFVEVKKSRSFDSAAHHLTARQAARILSAAAEFLGGEPAGELTPMRIDLALVNALGDVRLIENAIGHG